MLAALLIAAPAAPSHAQGGLDLRELGELSRELFEEMQRRLAPMLEDLEDVVQNLDDYEAPEILPNGDIIIRRKRPDIPPFPDPDDPPEADRTPDAEGSIDL